MKIESLDDLKKSVSESLLAYHKYLLDDNEACLEEKEFEYAKQRMSQVQEFYPVMTQILTMVGNLTPFKE